MGSFSMSTYDPVWVWDLPLAPITRANLVLATADLIRARRPTFVVTASSHYAMLSAKEPRLRAINNQAAFVVADGAPLVWASRLNGTPLPERVAGSDLIFDLCELSAREGFRVYLLGAAEGVATEAATQLVARYPGLVIAGTACPPFQGVTRAEHDALIADIRATEPDHFWKLASPKETLARG